MQHSSSLVGLFTCISRSVYKQKRLPRALHADVGLFTCISMSVYMHQYVFFSGIPAARCSTTPPPAAHIAPAAAASSSPPTAYVSIRQHSSAYVSMRTLILLVKCQSTTALLTSTKVQLLTTSASLSSGPAAAYVSIRQHTSAYVSMRTLRLLTTSASLSSGRPTASTRSVSLSLSLSTTDDLCVTRSGRPAAPPAAGASAYDSIRQHTSAHALLADLCVTLFRPTRSIHPQRRYAHFLRC